MGNRNKRSARRDLASERTEFLQSLRDASGSRRSKPDYRAIMFCRQVQRALMLAFGGEVHDELLQQLTVESVQPAPTCNHLLVSLGVPANLQVSLPDLLARVERAAPILRAAIASASSRKRVPELSFIPVSTEQTREVDHD